MLAPNSETVLTQLNTDYAANSFLMAWSHTLLDTRIYPITPKPAWLDRIAGELDKAQKATQPWLYQEYPEIAAALPQSLVDYGNLVLPALELLGKELAKTPVSRAKVIELIESLQEEAHAERTRVEGLRKQIDAYAPKVAEVAAKAAQEAQEVVASVAQKNRKVLALQARIADLQSHLAAISADAKNAMRGAATTGAGLTMTLMSFTVTAAVGAASFPVFGLVGAFIGIGVNAAIQASKSEEVINTIREIGQLSLELSGEQHQAAAMTSVAKSLERLSDQAGASAVGMVGSLHHWEDICADLDLLRELAEKPGLELASLLPLAPARLRAAAAAWKSIVAGAGKIQAARLQVAPKIEVKVEL